MEPNTKVVYEKLAFEMLTGANNYKKWKRDVKEYLSSKGLWGVASGQVKKPGAAKKDEAELHIWMEKAERAGGILHRHMSERMKVLVKEEMNPVEVLKNLEERINLKDGSKMVMAMHKLGRISLAESIDITDYFARIEEQVTILNSDPNEKMVRGCKSSCFRAVSLRNTL